MAAVRAVRLVGRGPTPGGGGRRRLRQPGRRGRARWSTGCPLVLVNVDAVPGAANRLLGRFAAASAVGWEGNPLPRAVVTGTPVRPRDRRRGPVAPGHGRRPGPSSGSPTDRSVVAVFGGSLGARRINRAVDGLAERWHGRTDVAIYHIVGRRDWDVVRPADRCRAGRRGSARTVPGPTVVRVPYEERMPAVYAAADVVVCRAGAMTVAELAAAGVPAVLVPLPGAPGDHQTANARVLERVGAAVLLPDPECTPAGLTTLVEGLLADPGAPGGHGSGGPTPSAGPTPPPPAPPWWRPPPGPEARGDGRARRSGSRRRHLRRASAIRPPSATSTWSGIGGAGMSAIATVLQAMGHQVSGSDLRESAVTERLRALGVEVAIGHAAANVGDADLVTRSTAVGPDNPEVVEAPPAGPPRADPGRDPGRHRRPAAVHRRGRHPRQDHDGLDAGADPGRGRAAARRS